MLLFESQGFMPINFSVVNGFKFISWNSPCWSSNRTRQFSYSKTTFLKMTQALPNNYPSFLPVLFKFSELPYIYLKFSLDWRYSFPSFAIYFLLNIVFLKIVLGWGRWWCKTIAHPIYICTNLNNSNFNLSLLWCIFMYIGFFTKFCSW